ncbi:IS66 family transposase [Micromonospora craniellae]|nr:IS66 family transposase [Micromonospora craniellae]
MRGRVRSMCCDRWVPGLEELSREELIGLTRRLIVQVEQLTQANRELTDRVARLERLVSRNSGNSGMPPSKDDDPGRTPPAEVSTPVPAAGAGKRSRGKQRGAPGAQLSWSPFPDGIVDHFPGGPCGCGSDLASAADLGVYASHQQVDVPAMTATVTQHDRHAVRCGCGAMHVAARPEGVPDAGVSYGPNLQAWCVYLMVVHAIPVARCADLVAALTGSRPSDGFVHALIGRAAAGVAESNRIIRTLIALAHVVSCDETPIRVGARKVKKYLLVACTRLYTWYLLGDRSLDTFKVFVLPDLTGVVVHDRYQNYDAKIFAHLVHQLCVAHLIRDCQDAAETYPDAHWPIQIRQALQGLVHAANLARAQNLPAIGEHIAGPLIDAYRHGVRIGLKEVARVDGRKQPKHRALLEDLHDREADILRFTTDLRIPPTSNQAERDLRPAKTQQKISGRLTSEKVTEHRYAIRGYVSTVTKHGADVMTAIRDAILGRPWTPPAWAPG